MFFCNNLCTIEALDLDFTINSPSIFVKWVVQSAQHFSPNDSQIVFSEMKIEWWKVNCEHIAHILLKLGTKTGTSPQSTTGSQRNDWKERKQCHKIIKQFPVIKRKLFHKRIAQQVKLRSDILSVPRAIITKWFHQMIFFAMLLSLVCPRLQENMLRILLCKAMILWYLQIQLRQSMHVFQISKDTLCNNFGRDGSLGGRDITFKIILPQKKPMFYFTLSWRTFFKAVSK